MLSYSYDAAGRLLGASYPGNQVVSYAYDGAGNVLSVSSATVIPTPTPTPAPATAPSLVTGPASQTVNTGATAAFWVTVSGSAPLKYQWNLNGTAISGASSALLTLANAQSGNQGSYTVTVSNSAGSVTSSAATLTVSASTAANPISFASAPVSQTIASGSTVVFYAPVAVSSGAGSVTPTYQWFFNGVPVAGATGQNLIMSNASTANNGSYSCVATDADGSVVSGSATLNVVRSTNPGRLINISCRAQVGTGSNQLIAGYVIGGQGTSGSEPVLIRASGPSLESFGVTGTLPDPELVLNQSNSNGSSTELQSDAGWGGNALIASTSNAVGAFALVSASSLDSAIVRTLTPGPYTAQVLGASGDTGVALTEVYDATLAGTYTLQSPRIINISARVQVGTGGSILIAGFVIGGTTAETVLIRASGPALTQFGVPGVLGDPQLKLYQSNSDGSSTLLQTNSGWGGNAQIAATAASVGAFSWGSTATPDSAILVTLQPGPYTAEVAGASGDTGVALVEVYEVP